MQGLKGVTPSKAHDIAAHVTATGQFETIGELGQYLIPSSGLTWLDREKHLASIANLVTVRSNVFHVTVLAQAIDRQGHKMAERRLEASVLRTIDIPPNPGDATVKVRVLSMRWVSPED